MALNIGWPMYSFENKNLQIKVWKVVNLENHNWFQMQMRQMIVLVYRNIGECNKLFLNHLNYILFKDRPAQIFYELPKGNEGIALLSTHDVHSAFRNGKAMEVCTDV